MERRLHLRIGTHEYAAFGEKALLIDAAIEEGLPVIHLQKKSAADVIITRNGKDFIASKLPVMTAAEYLATLLQ